MIIWINGAFGAGKTTLAAELQRRMPDAINYDPEYVGDILTRWVSTPGSGDFQDLPLWRKLAAQFAIALAAEYRRTLIVPMTLVNPQYRDEIFGLIGQRRPRHPARLPRRARRRAAPPHRRSAGPRGRRRAGHRNPGLPAPQR